MDILHLVDRLEELFNESRPIPLTHNVIVDEERMLDIIDQMRISIPEEMKKAQQLFAQKDRILAQAQEEANRTIALAREKADQLVDKDAVTQDAQRRSNQIIEQGRAEVEEIMRGADEYSLDALTKLQMLLEQILNQTRNGIRVLEEKHAPQKPPPVKESKRK